MKNNRRNKKTEKTGC